MKLILGGAGQGKRVYALQTYQISEYSVAESFETAAKAPVFDHFHLAVRQVLEQGGDPQKETLTLLEQNPNLIILCDEVGCGVVPMDAEERLWRETVGRLCCLLAQRADSVERIFCGIPMKLK